MGDSGQCPHCGKAVPSAAPGGLCPDCLLRVGLTAPTEEFGPNGTRVETPPFPVPSVSEIARHFPNLQILRCLGRGGMGVVYEARQPKLDRPIALKILAPGQERDPRFADRFEREARALARLSHPNIVAVHDFGEVDGLYYLLMEYVDGVSLRELLRRGHMKSEQALEIVPRICEALQYAHEKGVVHRDIKPENVLIDRKGGVKIADFGIAKILGTGTAGGHLTADEQVMGTPHYMAPEQLEQPSRVDHRADIYSLGVLLYEMLTGELPLGRFAPPSECRVQVDVRLDEVVLHALEKDPDRRYQHAIEVKTDVESIAGGRGDECVRSGEPGPSSSLAERVRRLLRGRGPLAVVWARRAARLLGLALVTLILLFVKAEGLPAIDGQPEGVQLNFFALGVMLAGCIAGLWRSGLAALIVTSGWTFWHISEGTFGNVLIHLFLLAGLLHGFVWWSLRGRPNRTLALASAGFVSALLLGLLLVPTSVRLVGRIQDADTGAPVAGAALTLLPRMHPRTKAGEGPGARSGKDGAYNLYIGWYRPGDGVSIEAPGFITRQIELSPRPIGRRRLVRNFELQTSGTAASPDVDGGPTSGRPLSPTAENAPPVVVRTIPESGAAAVDPLLSEIQVTFSKPMLDGGWSWASEEPSSDGIAGEARYLPDGRTCVLPVRLEPGRTYAFWLNSDRSSDFRDRDGHAAIPYLLIFRTKE